MGRVDASEVPLTGGNMGAVTRLGDEVRRPCGPWTAAVHRLLDVCAEAGIAEVPRPLGFTADGRERLTFLPGEVPHDPVPTWVWAPTVLQDAARLVRRLHEASVPLAGVADGWRSPVHLPAEVVCHNDVAPYNLVFADGRLTGLIDFDYASPGPRSWDLAHLAYRLVPLTAEPMFTASERRARLESLAAAYGRPADAADVLALVPVRLDELAAFSDRMAVELANPELSVHAVGYRADASRLRAGDLTAG